MFFVINSIYVMFFFSFFFKFYELTGLFIQRFKYLMLSGLRKEEEKKRKEGERKVGEKEGALFTLTSGCWRAMQNKGEKKGTGMEE